MTLETASPTFGVHLPVLSTWTIYPYRPPPQLRPRVMLMSAPSPSSNRLRSAVPDDFSEEEGLTYAAAAPPMPMDHAVSRVSSQGSVSATFRVPGLVNIPSDEGERSFTIVELQLNALMTWFSIPKVDTRVHLKVCPAVVLFFLSDALLTKCSFRRRSIMSPSTHSSRGMRACMLTGASFPRLTCRLLVQTNISTVLLGNAPSPFYGRFSSYSLICFQHRLLGPSYLPPFVEENIYVWYLQQVYDLCFRSEGYYS